jgi:DNA invertase Pin-like site-specific DNA recombinase
MTKTNQDMPVPTPVPGKIVIECNNVNDRQSYSAYGGATIHPVNQLKSVSAKLPARPAPVVVFIDKFVVIYLRYSDPNNQSMDSCEQQERRVRQNLDNLRIDHANAIVLRDDGIRGDSADRDAFVKLLGMLDRGEIKLLAVDEQSRFGRGFNVPGLVQDIVFHGGRFIAVADGIDTIREGWETMVGVKGALNTSESRTTGSRVRRGLEQRIHMGESAGDYPMGYRSIRDHEAEEADALAIGPRHKPRAKIEIHPEAAKVVRLIFDLFVSGMSATKIVRYLKQNKIMKYTKGRKRRADWCQQYVRKVLINEKYIGIWHYSRTRVMRNSTGKKKFVSTDPSNHITVERPELRILPQEIWEKALEIRRRNASIWGMKPGEPRRGPRPHYAQAYPKSLLSGIVRCGSCGRNLHLYFADGERRLRCPGTVAGECTVRAGCPVIRTEEAITDILADLLLTCPPWVAAAALEFRKAAERLAAAVPSEIERVRRALAEARKTISNLVGAISRGLDSPAVREELAATEETAVKLETEIAQTQLAEAAPAMVPTDEQIAEMMRQLATVLRTDPASQQVIRGLLRDVRAIEIILPGRVRGHIRLTFRVDAVDLLRLGVKPGTPAEAALNAIAAAGAGLGDNAGTDGVFAIDLGQTSKAERLGPKIAEMRARKIPWRNIADTLGITVNAAYVAERYWRTRCSGANGSVCGNNDSEAAEGVTEGNAPPGPETGAGSGS